MDNDSTWHLKWATEVIFDRLCTCSSFKAANTVISTLINYSLSPFPSDHFPLKNDMNQKTIFLNSDSDSYFPELFPVAPNGFNFWLRWTVVCSTMCLFGWLLYFSFPLLQNMNLLICTPQACFIFIETVHFQLQTSSNHHCCTAARPSVVSLSYYTLFLCLSLFGRTLEMMAHCTSPRWPQPTWATIPVMPMVTRNCFRPTLSKWMVRCFHMHITHICLNYLILNSHLLHSTRRCERCLTIIYRSISILKTIFLD